MKKKSEVKKLDPFKAGNYSDYYPIEQYEREDCDELFIQMYESSGIGRMALNLDGGYYMTEGVYLFPDGSFGDEDGNIEDEGEDDEDYTDYDKPDEDDDENWHD
jgi:hypothetical protein